MMTAEESLKQGDIDKALQLLQDQIRSDPSDAKLRVFLFQLLVLLGNWDRAITQLNVAADMDHSAIAMKMMYSQVLNAEAFRESVFQGEKEPVIFGEPQEWVALLIQALKLSSQGHHQQAAALRAQAFDAAPATAGDIDGKAFTWIADADPRLGPILEAVIEGRYMWVPFENISSIVIEEPEDLRDLVWLPAHFQWTNGGESYGLIPTRYPDSYRSDDPQVVLSRKTEWKEMAEDFFVGYGPRLLTTNDDEHCILSTRLIRLGEDLDA